MSVKGNGVFTFCFGLSYHNFLDMLFRFVCVDWPPAAAEKY